MEYRLCFTMIPLNSMFTNDGNQMALSSQAEANGRKKWKNGNNTIYILQWLSKS